MKKRITILIPSYNEEAVLPKLYDRLDKLAAGESAYDFEFLFVDDGSRDLTLSIIKDYAEKDKRVAYVSLSRNFGKEAALLAGIDNAEGDAVVVIDADLQDPPELIPEMVKYWREGYEDVYAQRKSRAGESFLKKLTAWGYYKVLQRTTRVPIQINTGDFRLLDRKCILALREVRENQRNMKALFSWIGYKKKEITYSRDARAAGKTHFNYLKLINLSIDGITSFTTAPLRLATVIGLLVALAAFVYIFVIIFKTLIWGVDVGGYASLMSVILFLGGVQLIAVGVLGEYIARIFVETKGRPVYLIGEMKVNERKS
jgi:glycosyltransferase involved in cell wall biosynthesis